ncbi:YjiH family protein [Tissierella pigra]|uniref:YjiH family protein n=1 Tax=Tissierella pigra TaxID=2607614 RepID=A0A6N7XHH3_9FIRM|nr:nucleoside recognition domain-containing protein [Tissierella pigra]MBU5424922.1 YjiH family protein [Tissierella pigra]MSU01136.1 YjiH family protein [Tissierella pigra]
MTELKTINLSKNKDYDLSQLDLNDPKVLDSIELDRRDWTMGAIKAFIISAIAIFVFFVPINGGIPFGYIYQGAISIVDSLIVINGQAVGALLLCTIVLMSTGIASVIGKFFSKKESKLYKYFEADSIIHPFLYLAGGIFILLYFLNKIGVYSAPEMIVGPSTGEMVIPGVVIGVAFIIPVGAFFIPFLTDYGCIDFFGVLLEPLMRPLFKTPGKSAVDACASFVGSTTMGIIITSRMYRGNIYTEKESSIVATCFSAVSVGYALLVMETAGIGEHFIKTYFVSFLLAFILAAICSRLWPLNKKRDVFANGKVQTDEDRKEASLKFGPSMLKAGVNRASVRAHTSGGMFKRIVDSVVDSFPVLPKVITLLCSIGILGMIVAKYTPVFDIIGYAFLPLTKLLGVPDAQVAATAIPTGITEMFIPVLTIADKVAQLHIKTRFFVTVVSMVQIIFLAESVVVIMNTGLPLKFKELMIIFLQRTIIAMPFAALFMHILF